MRKATICCLAAALLIGLGLWRGEADVVLHKGINLCLECVGHWVTTDTAGRSSWGRPWPSNPFLMISSTERFSGAG